MNGPHGCLPVLNSAGGRGEGTGHKAPQYSDDDAKSLVEGGSTPEARRAAAARIAVAVAQAWEYDTERFTNHETQYTYPRSRYQWSGVERKVGSYWLGVGWREDVAEEPVEIWVASNRGPTPFISRHARNTVGLRDALMDLNNWWWAE